MPCFVIPILVMSCCANVSSDYHRIHCIHCFCGQPVLLIKPAHPAFRRHANSVLGHPTPSSRASPATSMLAARRPAATAATARCASALLAAAPGRAAVTIGLVFGPARLHVPAKVLCLRLACSWLAIARTTRYARVCVPGNRHGLEWVLRGSSEAARVLFSLRH